MFAVLLTRDTLVVGSLLLTEVHAHKVHSHICSVIVNTATYATLDSSPGECFLANIKRAIFRPRNFRGQYHVVAHKLLFTLMARP